jgi:hypothetical protein
MKQIYKISKVQSLGEYISYLGDAHDADDLLFRGQGDDSPLRPKLGRIKLANRNSEKDMFNEFVRQLPSYMQKLPESSWDLLAIAQHHGMATRYLDWTTNPLAALWFAVEYPFRKKPGRPIRVEFEEVGEDYGVVWILKYRQTQFVRKTDRDPFRVKEIKIYNPPLIAARILAQAGFFTVHPPDEALVSPAQEEDPPDEALVFPALEEDPNFAKQLTKIVIPAKAFSDIRRSLDRCGFNAATMMVDLDGAASHITWQNSLLEDEAEDTVERTVKKLLEANPKMHIFRGLS